MLEHLKIGDGTVAIDSSDAGPLVVLAHGMGDSRHSYRFVVPALLAAGYRVANVDIRGCGDSSTGWAGYERADIAEDLVAVVRRLSGPAVVVGHSISGGAATVAAAVAPEAVVGVVELAPFTRKQGVDVLGLLRHGRVRAGMHQLARVMLGGGLPAWLRYLDVAIPVKPVDWAEERGRIERTLADPARMAVLRAMARTSPVDAGRRLADVRCPVLVVEGSADPDWTDPRAEGERILADLPDGLGELAVIEGAGHYPHVETPAAVVALLVPFLDRTLRRTAADA